METKFRRFVYDGPVIRFDRCIAENWKAETYAPSKTKATRNLVYRYNTTHGFTPNTRMILIDGVKEV